MATYAIGDVQGCYDALQRLLEKIRFDPAADRLWFCGDLVNRGGQSLETLRLVHSLAIHSTIVLGNHDLSLLAISTRREADQRKVNPDLQRVLFAEDTEVLIKWLRQQKLFHVDRTLGFAMVHAGLTPKWTIPLAEARARALEAVQADFTLSFRALAVAAGDPGFDELPPLPKTPAMDAWLARWRARCGNEAGGSDGLVQRLKASKNNADPNDRMPARAPGSSGGGLNQRTCVGMGGLLKYLLHRAVLHHLAIFHDEHVMGHGANHVHVVRDQQIAQLALALQALQQGEHLFLHRHVQRAGGFVQHQHLRAHDQRSGNGQALALPA